MRSTDLLRAVPANNTISATALLAQLHVHPREFFDMIDALEEMELLQVTRRGRHGDALAVQLTSLGDERVREISETTYAKQIYSAGGVTRP